MSESYRKCVVCDLPVRVDGPGRPRIKCESCRSDLPKPIPLKERRIKCAICSTEFVPRGSTARYCGLECVGKGMIEAIERQRARREIEKKSRPPKVKKIKEKKSRKKTVTSSAN